MSEAQKPKISPDRFAALIISSAVGFGLVVMVPQVQAGMHRSLCAPGSFLDTVPASTTTLTALPLSLMAFALVGTIMFWPPGSRAPGAIPHDVAGVVRLGCAILVTSLAMLTALSVWVFAPSSLCMGTDGLTVLASRISHVRQFAWRDVTGIEVSCNHGKGGDTVKATFDMAGGVSIGVPGDGYLAHLENIAAALHGLRFRYDASSLAASSCSKRTKAMLAGPP